MRTSGGEILNKFNSFSLCFHSSSVKAGKCSCRSRDDRHRKVMRSAYNFHYGHVHRSCGAIRFKRIRSIARGALPHSATRNREKEMEEKTVAATVETPAAAEAAAKSEAAAAAPAQTPAAAAKTEAAAPAEAAPAKPVKATKRTAAAKTAKTTKTAAKPGSKIL